MSSSSASQGQVITIENFDSSRKGTYYMKVYVPNKIEVILAPPTPKADPLLIITVGSSKVPDTNHNWAAIIVEH